MDEIKYLIITINGGKEGEYKKDFIKVRFESGNNLPLNKILKFHMLAVVARSAFEEDEK